MHLEVGQQLKLRPQDKALICGADAASLRQGLINASNREEQVVILNSPQEASPALDHFDGAVLLKGSRSHRLETLLPGSEVNMEVEKRKAC